MLLIVAWLIHSSGGTAINFTEHMEEAIPNGELLKNLVGMKMPFGRYKGSLLYTLPVSYLEWFARKGFPPGKMGMLLSTLYEIKLNGLEYLLDPLKKN